MNREVEKHRWRQIDSTQQLAHCDKDFSRHLYYARILTVRRSYSYSETNQLIRNLKKSVDSNQAQLAYKEQAISKMVDECTELLSDVDVSRSEVVLIPVPSSKTIDDPLYDNRIERVTQGVEMRLKGFLSCSILQRTKTIEPQHQSQSKRDVNVQQSSMEVAEGVKNLANRRVILVDDVITSGATVQACCNLISEYVTADQIIGIFWAKAQEPPIAEEFDQLF